MFDASYKDKLYKCICPMQVTNTSYINVYVRCKL